MKIPFEVFFVIIFSFVCVFEVGVSQLMSAMVFLG